MPAKPKQLFKNAEAILDRKQEKVKTSKEAIVGRAWLWILISVLVQLNQSIILFDSNSANFGNKIWVHIWIIHEILYEIDTHIE